MKPRVYSFGGSPWARNELARDPDRSVDLTIRAAELAVNVGIVGRTEAGPWTVYLTDRTRSLRFVGRELHDTIAFGLDRWAAGADDTGIRWTAGPDRLEHGHFGRLPRTLCGQPAIPEQTAHPGRARCQACWRALDRHPTTEADLFRGYGLDPEVRLMG